MKFVCQRIWMISAFGFMTLGLYFILPWNSISHTILIFTSTITFYFFFLLRFFPIFVLANACARGLLLTTFSIQAGKFQELFIWTLDSKPTISVSWQWDQLARLNKCKFTYFESGLGHGAKDWHCDRLSIKGFSSKILWSGKQDPMTWKVSSWWVKSTQGIFHNNSARETHAIFT